MKKCNAKYGTENLIDGYILPAALNLQNVEEDPKYLRPGHINEDRYVQ